MPHCADNGVYMPLIDPNWKKKVSKRQRLQQFVDRGDWAEVEDEKPKPKKRAAKQRGEKPADDVQGSDSDSGGCSGGESSSGSSSSSSSSSTNSSSNTSRSSSGSSSKSSQKSKDNVKASPKEKAKPKAGKANRIWQARSQETRIPFGQHWATPRYSKVDGTVTGYAMSCTCVEHQKDGRCSRELSIAQGGSEDNTLRILMAWIVFGQTCKKRSDHRQCFNMVRKIAAEGMLPSLEELKLQVQREQHAVVDISGCEEIASSSIPEVPLTCGMRMKRKARPTPRGPRGDVPADVWRQAEEMMADGRLPRTTNEQRERCKMVPNTDYGTPPSLHIFFLHGFLHPNLPAPNGMAWKCMPGKWWLSFIRGG